ncbi:hypothetical protein BGW38_006034 [Lunasporangiospora selenospora]|uniref:Uncharacterized protein n=1 Tax=Lunasporangiospora selenospora TaxID=979761 RepID=A0A9P6KGC2_9FUNG|nr:hypothetical protein BGW38_006034 [Lunasporangiospora selenospora]
MEKQRQLYDIDTVAIWTPNDNPDLSLEGHNEDTSSESLHQPSEIIDKDTKRKIAHWKHWILRRIAADISPLFLTTTVPSGISSTLTPLKSSWQLSLSPDSHFLAVNQEDKIEFRSFLSGYQAIHAVWISSKRTEMYPKWRRIAWSLDSKLVARSFSDGTVEIINVKGQLIGTILPTDQQSASVSDKEIDTASNQLFVEPLSFLGFTQGRRNEREGSQGTKYSGHEYAYELVTITYDGILRSYLFNTSEALDIADSAPTSPIDDSSRGKSNHHRMSLLSSQSLLNPRRTRWPREGYSDPGLFCLYHKYSFQRWLRTVACASIDDRMGVLCVGGSPLESKSTSNDESSAPYYRGYQEDEALGGSGITSEGLNRPSGINTIKQTIQKLFERDESITKGTTHTLVAHENYGLLSLDGSGSLTSWALTKEKGGVAKMEWDRDRLNYFARSKEHGDLSFEAFQKLVKEYHSNGASAYLIGLVNGKCVSMRYWTKDAILLGFESGAMIVLQIPELVNILGDEPKVFATCQEFTNSGFGSHDEQVFVIEEITRMIRARVVGNHWIMLSDQEDKALGEPTEQEIAQMMGNEGVLFKMIAQLTKLFESRSAEDHQAKRQKLILVPKRTLSLHRVLRVPPVVYMYRKLEAKEYTSALEIAKTYELDEDKVYKYQWKHLTQINTTQISSILDRISDKEWVLAHCIDYCSDDHESVRVLLEYGLQLTETLLDDIVKRSVMDKDVKLDLIRAAASGTPMKYETSQSLLKTQLTPKEILWCKYRWCLLKYLNRLSTYVELSAAEKDGRQQEEVRLQKLQKLRSPTSDPLNPLNPLELQQIDYEEQTLRNQPLLSGTYATFRDVDLASLACLFAGVEFIEGIRILFTRHNRETWPWRLAITNRIPETCPTECYRELLPKFDRRTGAEKTWMLDHSWRDMDWVDVPEIKTLTFGSVNHELDIYLQQQAKTIEERKAAYGGDEAANLDMAMIIREAEEILPSPEAFPATGDRLSQWYINRSLDIDKSTGQLSEARRLVQYGLESRVPHLDTVSEDLEVLCKLLYEIRPEGRSPEARARFERTILDMSLEKFSEMNPMQVVQICLLMCDERTIVQDIRHLVLPYLTVIIPRRWYRKDTKHTPGNGLPSGLDPHNPMSYLYAFLLLQSPEHLSWVGAVVEASKPIYEPEVRIIRNDMDLSWLTMSCMYGCGRMDEWKAMSSMIVCLPVFGQTEDVNEAVDRERRAQLRKGVTSESSDAYAGAAADRPRIPQQLDPLNMYPAFAKYAPTPGLMQHALDTLEQHLTAAETLARYDLPVPLSWFLENSDSEASQTQMIIKMARLASGGPEKMGERFESDDEWMLLLEDLIRLRGGEKGGGVLGLVSEQDIYREYLAGVLSCGKFELAKAILFPPGMLPPVRLATAEKLVIDCSNDFYNNAISGNKEQGLMKMAYDCLRVLPETTNIRREMDLIEATDIMTAGYKLKDPGTGSIILPLQIRSTENRLSLVRDVIMTQENAYHDVATMLELAFKLTGIRQKKSSRQRVEIQVLCMLIEASLKERKYLFCIQQSDRLIELMRVSGSLELNSDGSQKLKGTARASNSSSNLGNSPYAKSQAECDSLPSRSDSPVSTSSSRPASRAGGPIASTKSATSSLQRASPSISLEDSGAKKPWEIFVRVGSESDGQKYSSRLAVTGYALSCCPPDKIESVLEIWRSLEMESELAPVPETDPRRGIAGFMSSVTSMIDRTTGPVGLVPDGRSGGLGIGTMVNVGSVGGSGGSGAGPLAEILERGRMDSSGHSQSQSLGDYGHGAEGGRKRDALKSLVNSIWSGLS